MKDVLRNNIYQEIKEILNNSRSNIVSTINNEIIVSYWKIGKIIVKYEQNENIRAEYGKSTLLEMSKELTKEFGKGFSVSNIQYMRRFYKEYQIQQTLSVKLSWSHFCELLNISDKDKRSFY